ncbi:protein-methionine-sulfoxide reductase heme-binding subunit MsrQ [Vibrio penaeicida]|uniref:Protein-methionine-sulfoxide reductase heme-binding subunit MsrQ n=1 Tax=Vibrio penaeicida TaxID=104609 RepID=A0AAV5NJX2_9VIBR|nr:protein-methionine-sulfoxide reductase heme-binding subunit MsrQ [Vibrio penaeicida]RTZ20749.1 sulfoxide reductase heme-binding subunit YedZ [Vibrio penaeicida]GLQ70903.1 protein-methionine-sulfoxide reductase heme-binding subunit MsrQ [Vibrio penaeicida]
MTLSNTHIIVTKALIHVVQWFSLLWLFMAATNGHLGAEPVDEIIHFTGKAALNTLIATMLITPLVRWLKIGQLIRTRRLLGVFAFMWAALHLLAYVSLDLGYEWLLILDEIITRPYLIVGALSWIILLLLTVTSTKQAQRKLKKRWQALHNWVYIAVLLIPIHYLWSVKSVGIGPVLYLTSSFLLLLFRKDKVKRWLVK